MENCFDLISELYVSRGKSTVCLQTIFFQRDITFYEGILVLHSKYFDAIWGVCGLIPSSKWFTNFSPTLSNLFPTGRYSIDTEKLFSVNAKVPKLLKLNGNWNADLVLNNAHDKTICRKNFQSLHKKLYPYFLPKTKQFLFPRSFSRAFRVKSVTINKKKYFFFLMQNNFFSHVLETNAKTEKKWVIARQKKREGNFMT